MKNPIDLWDELTITGKLFFWWIIPVYYFTSILLIIIGIIFYGIYSALQSYRN